MKFSADFETLNNENDCRVWATGICSINNENYFYAGNNINFFFEFAERFPNSTFYFHNLKFDGEFIINYLFRNGYKHDPSKRLKNKKTFNTLISDKGMFYSMEILTETNNHIKIYDSLKILPFSVAEIAKAFGLPIRKGSIDYDLFREVGHILTQEEIDYLQNDVEIVASALQTLFNQGLTKMTQGSNALADYKKLIKNNFNRWFPIPKYDKFIRESYKGGFTYCNPKFKGKEIKEGIVLDVNSLYPWVMAECLLPYGEEVYFKGKYEYDRRYPLYVQNFTCQFTLKPNHIPTVQLKNHMAFIPTEYISDSNGEDITLSMTNVDLKLFFDNYDVYNIEYHYGWKFRGAHNMFKDYIDKWYSIKVKATIDGNKPMRTLAKLMLNALYGKFGLNPNVRSRIPMWDGEQVHYVNGDEETREPIYIPMASFITAYAREKTIRSAMSVYDRFIYADTDSLHLVGWDIPEGLEIHNEKLGAWKIENKFKRAKFLRAKSYVEVVKSEIKVKGGEVTCKIPCWKLNITCAGMPKSCYKYVTFDNFQIGNVFPGKLQQKRVKGGIILKEIEFTLRG